MTAAAKLSRCAIYTRKSTEHNLDLAFNSLDAQREACEAYIKSQEHEGWRLIPTHYDDGAFSGASLERPAVQALLLDIKGGKIDTVVVYKVDRLTRSLTDFAKLVETFDQHKVSFVSITQAFNTTSSMGRLTLNVLLSFAQFEREVIGERVRDKISASKRKGLWVGGPVPLGYASIDKKLVVVEEEAERVKGIFRRYLELGSIGALVEDLDRRGIKTKRRALANGGSVGDGRFRVGSLAHLIRNRFYIGDVVYRGETYPGEHDPILDRALFEAVQTKLSENAVERRMQSRSSPALLTGRIFDERGNRMTPSHSNKRGVRYRYYVSQAVLQRKKSETPQMSRVSAPDIESLVLRALREHLGVVGASERGEGDRDLLEKYVDRVVVKADAIQIILTEHCDPEFISGEDESEASTDDSIGPTVLNILWTAQPNVAVKGITHAPSELSILKPETREALLTAIAKARIWVDEIAAGTGSSFREIGSRSGNGERHTRLLVSLAFASPAFVRAILEGGVAEDVTITALARDLPDSWMRQRSLLHAANIR